MPGKAQPRTKGKEREKREQNLAKRKSKKTLTKDTSAGFLLQI